MPHPHWMVGSRDRYGSHSVCLGWILVEGVNRVEHRNNVFVGRTGPQIVNRMEDESTVT